MSLNRQALAVAAKRIIRDVAFDEVFRYLESSAYAEFMASEPTDSEARESIYRQVRALNDLRATLRNLAQEADQGEPDA
jgi:hypothetical protein